MPTQSPASSSAPTPRFRPTAPALGNRVLAALSAELQQRLVGLATPLTLEKGAVLVEAGSEQTHVYFPCSGLLSLQTMTQDGNSVEVAMVGREGVAPLPFIADSTAVYTTLVTVPGDALRLRADALQAECERTPHLQRVLMQCWHAMISEIATGSACHRFHSARQRLACWLLRTSERVQSSEIELTQEQLAGILGLQRTGVTVANVALQDYGAITSRHGRIRIIDRTRLQRASCDCHTS